MEPKAVTGAEVLERLSRELAATIRRTLAESPQVAACLGRARKDGFDVSLVLEATIGLRHVEGGRELDRAFDFRVENPEPSAAEMTPLDRKFLRSLKISVDDEE